MNSTVSTTRRFLEVARNEALRLGRLVDGMLDFSPLDLSPQPAPGVTDLTAAANAAVDALAPIARQAGMALEVRYGGEAAARIGGDACMHALLNVIENAIKYGSSRWTRDRNHRTPGPVCLCDHR